MYIDINNIRIHYEILGEGNSNPIILLNGNGKYTGYMKKLGNLLSKNYMVYLFDRRCSGKSTENCELTYEASAEDVYQFIQKLNISKPIVLGHSGGGTVVLHLAYKHKESLSKIILCSGVARYDKRINETLFERILKVLPIFPGKSSMERFEKLVNEAKTFSKNELIQINIPTLVINGSKDIVPIDEAMYISECISNSDLLILENETHQSYMTKINWFDKLINFIEK